MTFDVTHIPISEGLLLALLGGIVQAVRILTKISTKLANLEQLVVLAKDANDSDHAKFTAKLENHETRITVLEQT